MKGRSGRVIALRGGLWDDRVSYLKVTLITEVIQFAFGAQTKVPSRGPLTSEGASTTVVLTGADVANWDRAALARVPAQTLHET